MRHPLSTSVAVVVGGSFRRVVFGHGGVAGRPVSCPLWGGRGRRSGCGGWRAAPVAVGGVDCLVIEHALGQAVPEDFEPAVAELAQRGVVAVAGGGLLVVELPGPGGPGQAAEGPLLYRFAQVAVVGQAPGDGELAAPGAPGDRRAACVAL